MKKNKELEPELENQYGKILLKSFARYWGGHDKYVAGGTLTNFSLGMMYLFENHFLFRSDVVRQDKYWEILIPINSIMIDKWNPDQKTSKNLTEEFGVFEDKDRKKKLMIPFIDNDDNKHKPIFDIPMTIGTYKSIGVARFGGGGLTKWMEVFYDVIKNFKKKSLQLTIPNHDVEKWIEEGEGTTLDFKRSDLLSAPHKLSKPMTALANNKTVAGDIGGKIVIGISDNRVVEGVKFSPKHQEYVMQVGSNNCKPPIKPIFERINHLGKTLYVISIPKMKKFPHRSKTKDGWIFFIRVGDTTREPTEEELAELHNTAVQNKHEEIRNQQILEQIYSNCISLKGKMEYLKGVAKSRELMITQFKDYVDAKNSLIDQTKEIISNPFIVLNAELKSEISDVLNICRYKPAWESLDPALKMARERKLLENGWKRDYTDFDIGSRFVDNNTDEAIISISNLLTQLEQIVNPEKSDI